MRNVHWEQYPYGSAEQVIAHALYRKWQGKTPTMSFMGIRNPRRALAEAYKMRGRVVTIARVVGDHVVFDDQEALDRNKTANKSNCGKTLELNAEWVVYYKDRIVELGQSGSDTVILVANINDANGMVVVNNFLPGYDWLEIKEHPLAPTYVQGLVDRRGMLGILDILDKDTSVKLLKITCIAVVVIDHTVAEVFAA